MSEFGLISRIREMASRIPSDRMEGIGDDCAVFGMGNGRSLLFTSDLLTEGIHFRTEDFTPQELAYKALTVNLSDIAAMGGKPVATLLSIALPKRLGEEWALRFMEGYSSASESYSTLLAGGDTCSAESSLTLSVTAIGEAEDSCIKRRRDARVSDRIYVTGRLGASSLGLRDILSGNRESEYAAIHRHPRVFVKEGLWLGRQASVHAMMDVSDGIASDLRHILEESNKGAEVEISCIPSVGGTENAVCGGEDYVLLFTAGASFPEEEYRRVFGEELHAIGTITDSDIPEIRWTENKMPFDPKWRGYEHF